MRRCLIVSLCITTATAAVHTIYQRTSISVNIKERLDFSCALFDSSGGLVANAPHLPVHLGAMQEAVKYQVSTI
jgi:5-oxoprolinase (ATP-hydrolysing)